MKELFVRAHKALTAAIDAIVPPKKRTARLREISESAIPLFPTSHELLGVKITTLMDYKDDAVRDLIQSLKYDGGGKAAHLLASVVAEYLAEDLATEAAFSTRRILLIPLPLHTWRHRERGYNQIETVLDRLPIDLRDGTRAHLRTDVLDRTRATKPQTRLQRSERLSNVAGAFALRRGADVSHAHIYLIDDVTTTGATLANAATPLRRAGASVSLIALARA